MKNIEEKILMTEEEIKQLQNKRKKLISQQKQEERKKRDRRIYEKEQSLKVSLRKARNLANHAFASFLARLISLLISSVLISETPFAFACARKAVNACIAPSLVTGASFMEMFNVSCAICIPPFCIVSSSIDKGKRKCKTKSIRM